MLVSSIDLVEYMCKFVILYRNEFEKFTSPPPQGAGYPKLEISPFIFAKKIQVYISRDSIIMVVLSEEPFGAYLVGTESFTTAGFGDPIESEIGSPDEKTTIRVEKYDLEGISLLDKLTYGWGKVFFSGRNKEGKSLFPKPEDNFGEPCIIRRMNFQSSDKILTSRVDYISISPHTLSSDWDKRNIPVRVQFEVRRDFQQWTTEGMGSFQPRASLSESSVNRFDRLSKLERAIKDFEDLLKDQPNAEEWVYHNFLFKHPELLDLYGDVESKPRFIYPPDDSPLGKEYVEPDFIIRYPHNSYKLVELERPSKPMATRGGQPSADVTQAVFQTAEWITYIQHHYPLIKDKYPGICAKYSVMVVISRSNESAYKGKCQETYSESLKAVYGSDKDILNYDEILAWAKSAYSRIAALT